MNNHQSQSHDHDEHQDISVETLSTPPIHVRPAPFASRIVAALLDALVLVGIWIVVRYASRQPLPAFDASELYSASTLAFAAVIFLYYSITEWLLNASPGKLLLGLRVYLTDGNPCDLSASLRRNLLRFIDWLPAVYVIGAVSMGFSRDRQRLGDRWAHSVVTKAPEKDINPPPAPFLFH